MFRSAFLRSVLEALQRLSGGKAVSQLQRRLPEPLQRSLQSDALKTPGSDSLVSVDDAEELLLGIDSALGDGSGSVLESVGQELATRSYLLREGVLSSGSVRQCVERLGDMLLRPYVDVPTHFRIVRTDTGFNLAIGVQGRPRATRALRHLTAGCVRASFTFALEPTSEKLKLYAHTIGDRAEITVRYREFSAATDTTPPPSSRERPRPTARPSATQSVAQEVERILSGAPKASSEAPPSRRTGAQRLDPGEKFPGPSRLPDLTGTRRKSW